MNQKLNSITLTAAIGFLAISCGDSDSTADSDFTLKGSSEVPTVLAQSLKKRGNISPFAVDPAELKVKIYKFAVSESELCTNPITVFEDSNPEYQDFYSNPTIGDGNFDDGTYPCVILEMSDTLKFTPAETEGACVEGEEYEINVCRDSESKLIDGTEVNCTNSEQKVALYLSTASTETNGTEGHNAFMPPTVDGDSAHGLNLADALVKSGSITGVFVVNGDGKVEENDGCDHQPPVFTFTTE